MRTMTAALALAVLLAPAQAGAYSASEAAGPADKEKELPKDEVEKRQEALNNDKRFDAYQKAVGGKADGLRQKIGSCKTEACFDSAANDLDTAKKADFMKAEPRAPAAAASSDASRDAFYRDGANKMGKLSQAASPAVGAEGLRDALGAGRPPAGQGVPVSQEALKNSQPVADLKPGAAASRGGPMEQAAPAAGTPGVGPDSPKPAVAKAQGELNAYLRGRGQGELKADGVYGPKTEQAVKDVQRQFGLRETGRLDPETREAVAKGVSKTRPEGFSPAAAKAFGGDPKLTRRGPMNIDTDGDLSHGDPALSALARRDPDRKGGTTLQYADGRSLDPTRVPYVVLPGGSRFARLGDLVRVEYNGRSALAVAGDIGPPNKFGEGSMALARTLGISPDGVRGGVESGVTYTFLGRNVGSISSEQQLMSILGADLANR